LQVSRVSLLLIDDFQFIKTVGTEEEHNYSNIISYYLNR
jgi:hypothetical protein